jgi:hypothetical protein
MAKVSRKGEKGNSSPRGGESKPMRLMRIQGRADKVFEVIKSICQRHPSMTLAEAGRKGLLQAKLQNTVPFEIGKFPEVSLDIGIENN